MWLEILYTIAPETESDFLFDMVGAKCPIRIKEMVMEQLRKTLVSQDMTVAGTAIGNSGTHSLRKYGTTFARSSGYSRDDVDVRVR